MADKYLKYDWLFTEMNRGKNFVNSTLIKAYNDQKEWRRDREFVERLSNDREIMLAVANSIALTPAQKEFFFGYMSPELNKDKDFLIKVMVANNRAEKTRAKEEAKLGKINVSSRYLTKEVLESLVEMKSDEFTTYSAGLDVNLFKDIIAKDAVQLSRIAGENKENPRFVKALIEVLVKSDEEVFKLPAVLAADLKYCEVLLTDEKYVKTLKENLGTQAHNRINALSEDFNQKTLAFRNLSEKNAKTYYDYFKLLDELKEDKLSLEEENGKLIQLNNELVLLTDAKEIKAKNKEIVAQQKVIEKLEKTIDTKEKSCGSNRFKTLNDMRVEVITKGNAIAEKYTKLIEEIAPVVEKAMESALAKKTAKELEKINNAKLKEEARKRKEEEKAAEEAAKRKEKEDKEKAAKKAKEAKDRERRKGVVVANYLDDQMKGNMTKLDNVSKGRDGR